MAAEPINFTVDSALLRELGERLVGQPHIALGELVKNSYDADARNVRISFEGDTLIVEDDGHGMSFDDFVQRWMRIGTTHKADGATSPELGRTLTGSKGVGRLATQILATRMSISSVALRDPSMRGYTARATAAAALLHSQVHAEVDWRTAEEENDLTAITVPVERTKKRSTFANGSRVGTRIVLRDLVADWGASEFKALARQVWALQPPFQVNEDSTTAFTIAFDAPSGNEVATFREQMETLLDNWTSFIEVELLPDDPTRSIAFEFDPLAAAEILDRQKDEDEDEDDAEDEDDDGGDEPKNEGGLYDTAPRDAREPNPNGFAPPAKLLRVRTLIGRHNPLITERFIRVPACLIDTMTAEIRVFNLTHKQPGGILVKEAREYMSQFGGVHIYDNDFRLPYYGPQDWLDVERDSARRLSRSQILPKSLRPAKAMQDLPARRRLFGVTSISTAWEARSASRRHISKRDVLAIQSSRDRLVTNRSTSTLRGCVRLALDLYATDASRSKFLTGPGATEEYEPPARSIDSAETVVQRVRNQIDPSDFQSLTDYLHEARENARAIEARTQSQSTLLGSLATVGMTTLAWEHEATKQRHLVFDASKRLRRAAAIDDLAELQARVLSESELLRDSAVALDEIASLFKPVLSRGSREEVSEMNARALLRQLVRQIQPLSRGAEINIVDIPKEMRLPPGTFAGWRSLFQNLLVNAFGAVLQTPRRVVTIDAPSTPRLDRIRIQDTGTGVDLDLASTLFEPFTRGREQNDRATRLGLGGSGLGLTIVRILANDMGVTVKFEEPDEGFSTSVIVEWERQ